MIRLLAHGLISPKLQLYSHGLELSLELVQLLRTSLIFNGQLAVLKIE
jgi:hypothetical protein